MKTTQLLLIFCSGLSFTAHPQSMSREILTAAGGTGIYKDHMIEWTLGELAIETYNSPDQIVTQGFQQPSLGIKSLRTVATPDPFAIRVFPNPVKDKLTIVLESKDDAKIIVHVTDMLGKKLAAAVTDSRQGIRELDFSGFQPGIYLLTILKPTGEMISTFRIAKVM